MNFRIRDLILVISFILIGSLLSTGQAQSVANLQYKAAINIDSLLQQVDDQLSPDQCAKSYISIIKQIPESQIDQLDDLFDLACQKCSKSQDDPIFYLLAIEYISRLNYFSQYQKVFENCESLLKGQSGESQDSSILYLRYYKGYAALYSGNLEEGFEDLNTVLHSNLSPLLLNRVNIALASYYRIKGNFKQAKKIYKQLLTDPAVLNYVRELSAIYNNLGRLFRQEAKYDSARIYYLASYDVSVANNDQLRSAKALNNLGNTYHIEGNLGKALEYYIGSLRIKEKMDNVVGTTPSYLNIGSVKLDKKDYKGALHYLRKGESASLKFDQFNYQVFALQKIGTTYREMENGDSAIYYHKQAIYISKEKKLDLSLVNNLLEYGRDLIYQRKFIEALVPLEECLQLARKNSRRNLISQAICAMAECYVALNESKTESAVMEDKEVESLLLEGISIADEIDSMESLQNAFQAIIIFYRKKKNYEKESYFSSQFHIYRDSLYQKQNSNAIAMWETRLETAEQEKEIIQLQKEQEIQKIKSDITRNRYFALFIFLLLAGAFIFLYLMSRNKEKRAKQLSELRTKISSDLHDDVGSLLSGLAMQADLLQYKMPEADQSKVARISDLGRKAMSRMRDAVWAMDARKDRIQDLLDRMHEFAEESLGSCEIGYKINVQGIDKTQFLPPDLRQNIYLIFKEALANIVKHSDADQVEILMEDNDDKFKMKIKDNGNVKGKVLKISGLGVSNMKMRADRMNGTLDIEMKNGFGIFLIMDSIS